MPDERLTFDPLDTLIAEHTLFRAQTRSFLDLVVRTAGPTAPQPLEPRQVASFASFLSDEVDRKHGAKEEEGLFPVLAENVNLERGPIAVLLSEHEDLRRHQRNLSGAATHLYAGAEAGASRQEVLKEAGEVHQLLDFHIEKEETVLFPLAREVLTLDDLEQLRAVFHRIDERYGPVRSLTPPPTTSSGIALPPFCAAGRARKDQAQRA